MKYIFFWCWWNYAFHPLFFLPVAQSPGLPRSQPHGTAQEKKFDLLSDLGGDIFAAPPTHTSNSANFANFAHFPSQSGDIFLTVPYSHWCRLKPLSNICPLVCHRPTALPCICFYLYIFSPLCMTAAHQVNSNANFANFDAFGNTAIPSHLNTSPPSKSLSSGTLYPTIPCLQLYPYRRLIVTALLFFPLNYSEIKIFLLICLFIVAMLQCKKIVLCCNTWKWMY